MIEGLPGYISITFIITTFLAVGFLFYAIRQRTFDSLGAKIAIFLIPFWLIIQAALALIGFYQDRSMVPPRVFAFGVFPAVLLIVVFFVVFRTSFVEKLPLKVLTILQMVRIPIELVLLWLFQQGLVPQIMTFEGRNFDILSGITAVFVYFLAFRGRSVNRPLLIVWNIFALLLVINIVTIAALSLPSPIQKLALDQPNIAVTYFPFIWLPSVVVPIVFFSHFASLWKLAKGDVR